jgi:hypothetical protein
MTADPTAEPSAATPRRWLLLVHQLPSTPSNLRVRTWRRLQQLGALPVKQAVYVLPDADASREDFEWLKAEIEAAGGEAIVFSAGAIDPWTDDGLVDAFRRSRQEAYMELTREVEQLLKRADREEKRRGARSSGLKMRTIDGLRQRLATIEKTDFFDGPGRVQAAALLDQLATRVGAGGARPARTSAAPSSGDRKSFRRRVWVTRPRPGVDRMSSAWLIRRFIDPDAKFGFAADRASAPAESVPFDMFGVEFTHQADRCTFEVLADTFAIDAPPVRRLAAIVHDLDLKDTKYGAPEAGAVALLIEGLRQSHGDDAVLLEEGIKLFESLYLGFDGSLRAGAARESRTRGTTPARRQRRKESR